MTACQNSDPLQSPLFAPLRQFLRGRRREGTASDFEQLEQELHEVMSELESELLGEELRKLDVDADRIEVGAKEYRQVALSTATYLTAAGPVEVTRHLYRGKGERRAICPLELRAGIVEGEYTPRAARLMARVMSEMPSLASEDLFREFGGMTPSRSALDRLPKRLSSKWEEHRMEWEGALRAEERVPYEAVSCAVSLDGVLVPMQSSEAHARQQEGGKQPKGPADFREVGCATVSFYDASGERLETRRFARMPESGMPTLKEQVRAEWDAIRSERPDLTLVRMSDGAGHHWQFLETLEAEETEDIEDFWHACDHLKTAADAMYGENSAKGRRFFQMYRDRLRDEENGVDALLRTLRYRARTRRKGREKVRAAIGYFSKRERRPRMQYARYQARNLPIGTGVTEAACKTLASERMKQSGMRWGMDGGQAILTLRSLIQSDRWERGWELMVSAYRQDIMVKAA